MTNNPRVLILTLSFGSGHVTAAENLAAEFRSQLPNAEVRVVDVLNECSIWFRALYAWTYWAAIRFAPVVWRSFFNARVKRRAKTTAPVWTWRSGCRKVFDGIAESAPDFIVAAEVGASEMAVIARRAKILDSQIVNVITDLEAEPTWVKPEIALYFVADERVGRQLVGWGADNSRIRVVGIPIGDTFAREHNADLTKRRFDLDDRPVVMLMGGGMGPTRMPDVAARLLKSDAQLQIVALPGKDEAARSALQKLSSSRNVSLKVLGWTNNVAPLMQSAQLLATKPGGLTLSEAAASGLPLVLFDSIPGPEETNARSFVDSGSAVFANGPKDAANHILRLLNDEGSRLQMAVSVRKMAQPTAARRIVELAKEEFFRLKAGQKSPGELNESVFLRQGSVSDPAFTRLTEEKIVAIESLPGREEMVLNNGSSLAEAKPA